MPIIWIETIPIKPKTYLFMQSRQIGLSMEGDWQFTYEADDRLRASIVNAGYASRYLVQSYPNHDNNFLAITSDIDGQDIRYEKEHNILYSLLCPNNDYEAIKYFNMYKEYQKWLHRLKDLIKLANIKIKLVDKNLPCEEFFKN